MQLTNTPAKLVLPFANAGAKNTIPTASQIGITAGAASLVDGFPPSTRTPIAAGGIPPSGLDMNGILFELSAILRWSNAGGGYAYDGTFATDSNVGGYPKGARIMRSDGRGYWFNTVENNVTDPEAAGAAAAGWVPDFTNGATSVAMTNANVVLTPLQYGKPVVVITGTLTANLHLIFPTLVNQWVVINNTVGTYTITCKTATGAGVAVASNVNLILGDGTNIQSVVTQNSTNVGRRTNFFDNGNFDIWQRGVSFNISTSGFHADRWAVSCNSFNGTGTVSRQPFAIGQTDVPDEPSYFERIQVTAATTGQTEFFVGQKIESVRSLAGKSAVLSFYAKADSDRTLTVRGRQAFGSGGSPSSAHTFSTQTISLASTWKRFILNFVIPSIAGKTLGTDKNHYLQFLWDLPLNSTFEYDLSHVQIQEGVTATQFEHVTQGAELAICQRYYEKSYEPEVFPGTLTLIGSCFLNLLSGSVEAIPITYKVAKRAVPTVAIYSPGTGAAGRVSSNGSDQLAGITHNSTSNVRIVNLGSIYRDFGVHFVAEAEL